MPRSILLSSLAGILLIVAIIFLSDINLNVLSENQNDLMFGPSNVAEGTFRVKNNNLGIVQIEFDPRMINKGIIEFSIFSLDDPKIVSKVIIPAKNILEVEDFPFGFPIYSNSEGKKYKVRIIYIPVNSMDRIKTGTRLKVMTKYVYPRLELINNPLLLSNFIVDKIKYFLSTPFNTRYLLLLLFPEFSLRLLHQIVIYYHYLKREEKIKIIDREFLLFFILIHLLLFLDLLFQNTQTNLIVLIVIVLTCLLIKKSTNSIKNFGILSVSLMIESLFFLLLNNPPVSDKMLMLSLSIAVPYIIVLFINNENKRFYK